jgi:hypothetical protein
VADNVSNVEEETGGGSLSPARLLRRAGAIDSSLTAIGDGAVGIRAGDTGWELLSWAPAGAAAPAQLDGIASSLGGGTLVVAEPSRANVALLRGQVEWLRPRRIDAAASAGTGDRLGIATPGQAAAFRVNPGIFPILAQQSARELMRTGRSFRDVVDAATLGVLASGWRTG